MDSSVSINQANEIIKFFKVELGVLNPDLEYFEHDLSNINSILDLLENSSIDSEFEGYNHGQELFTYLLMAGASTVKINEDNINTLKTIFEKLNTIQGLDEETIKDHLFLFSNEDIINRVCANSTLLHSAIQATTETTRESSIKNQSIQIINEVEQQNNLEQQEEKNK